MLSSYTPYVITQLADRREELPRRAMTSSRRRAARQTPRSPGERADH
jgi:hypothetical protein